MKRVWIAVLVVACTKRADDPPWAMMPSGGTNGESTIAQAPLKVRRFAQAPLLDGKLDDAAWADAATTAPFVEPGKGGEARGSDVAAFAKLGWDDRKLYVGAVIFDSSPVSPFGRDDVDPHDWEKSSALELMVQPGDPGNNTNYYEIQVDVHGATFDTKWDD